MSKRFKVQAASAGSPATCEQSEELMTIAEPSDAEIARLAYLYWEDRGRTGGSADEDWLRAETELRLRAANRE